MPYSICMQKTKIKDIVLGLDDLTFKEALEYLVKKASQKDKKTFVVTVNPEIVMLMRGDSDYEKAVMSADLRTVDGVGVLFAGKIFGKSFKERIHGADLTEELCREVAKQPITVGFLGGEGNVALKTAECLRRRFPDLKVAFALQEMSSLEFSKYSCDILFVAFGSPKQEKWIYENLSRLNVRVVIGVGGTFDFISGKVKRAPVFVRKLGLEWLFRLVIQPWRIRRQVKLIYFVLLVIKEKLFS